MAAPTKHDWGKISREYIEAPSDDLRPSLPDLAKKYNINSTTVCLTRISF